MSILAGSDIVAEDINLIVPIGVPLPYFGSTAPTDHLICNGDTIGDASSGATARANADTATLFALLWDSIANTELAIQDSAGAPSVRGASAAADFAAHKRMPLPDMRGYAPVGYKNGDADFGTLGDTLGAKTHQLTEAELATHHHTVIAKSGSGGSTLGLEIDGTGTQAGLDTGNAGSNTAHNNIQPSFTLNFIVRYKYYE